MTNVVKNFCGKSNSGEAIDLFGMLEKFAPQEGVKLTTNPKDKVDRDEDAEWANVARKAGATIGLAATKSALSVGFGPTTAIIAGAGIGAAAVPGFDFLSRRIRSGSKTSQVRRWTSSISTPPNDNPKKVFSASDF